MSICILPLDQPALCFTSCSFRPSSIQLVIALCLKDWGLTRFLIPASLAMFWIVGRCQYIVKFVNYWTDVKGIIEQILVFYSKLTTYDILEELDAKDIKFIILMNI
ncbi:MAG: hypothetical protein K8S18_19290 [Desulfobacula sp.]|nr:hypothetical protein [Desulfobacula sp.]